MNRKLIASDSFSNANKTYFLDYSLAENRSTYIRISRSDLGPDGKRHRSQVVIFEEDFHFLISAFASLFQSASYHAESHNPARR